MWQFEATFCSLFCGDWFQRSHQLWCYSCGSDWKAACLFIYLKDRRQRRERHIKASWYLFLTTFSGQRERSRNVLSWSGWAAEIRWHLFSFIAFVAGAGSVGLGWLRRLLAVTDADLLLLLLPRFDVKLPQVFWREDAFVGRPGPVCYSVTMEEKILLRSRFYTHCDVTEYADPEHAGKWSVYNGSFVFCSISSSH